MYIHCSMQHNRRNSRIFLFYDIFRCTVTNMMPSYGPRDFSFFDMI